jgi:hypothetical protein
VIPISRSFQPRIIAPRIVSLVNAVMADKHQAGHHNSSNSTFCRFCLYAILMNVMLYSPITPTQCRSTPKVIFVINHIQGLRAIRFGFNEHLHIEQELLCFGCRAVRHGAFCEDVLLYFARASME